MKISVDGKEINLDQGQQRVFDDLRILSGQILTQNKKKSFFQKIFPPKKDQKVLGLYIYGKVGRGKSMLMSNFFDGLKMKDKTYFHFNDFMQKIHEELHKIRKKSTSNNNDLVELVTKNLVKDIKLLCLDEFQVDDVTDALILRRIFSYIFKNNIKVVFTSNSYPEDLYQNGLQRDLFLKFIKEVLYENCQIVNLDSQTDYRTQFLQSVRQHYFYPINSLNRKKIIDIFMKTIDFNQPQKSIIEMPGRELEVSKSYKNIALFNFKDLCVEALGTADYKAICKKFDIIFLFDLPKLTKEDRNEAKRFILFIDEVYENKVMLMILSDVKPEEIYTQGVGFKTFKRTISRLKEITSEDYLQKSKFSLQKSKKE